MRVTPEKKSNQSNNIKKYVTAGDKIFAPIGLSYTRAKTGTLVMEITSVVIKDLENNNEEGVIHTEKFYVTEAALYKSNEWAGAMGVKNSFDNENRQEVENVFVEGVCFIGNVKVAEKTYNDRTWTERTIQSFSRPTELIEIDDDGNPVISITKAMNTIIENAELAFPKIIEARQAYGVQFVEPNATEYPPF